MEETRTAVEEFFRVFTQNTNEGDTSAQIAQFAATFLAAGPQGASCVRREDFARILPQRKQLFESLGCRSTELVGIQTDLLDARYSTVRGRWKLTFDRTPADQEILVDSTYVVDTGVQPFQIVFYLAHQDIMAILKERAILPA